MSRFILPVAGRESVTSAKSDSKNSAHDSRLAPHPMSTDGRHSSLRSWSAENAQQSSDLGLYLDSEAETEGGELLPKEEVVPYDAPPANFIRILFGASQVLIANSNCGKRIFMNYLISKIGVKKRLYGEAQLDLCSEDGTLLKLEKLGENDNIDHLFRHGASYLPCIIYMTDGVYLEKIKPCLKRWEKLYPALPEIFIEAIQKEQEEAKKIERSIAAAAAAAAAAVEKEKEKDGSTLDKKKKGK